MADVGHLFDLAASIRVDAKGVDKTLTDTQKKVLALTDDFKKLDKSTGSSRTGLLGISSSGDSAASAMGSLGTALPIVAGASVAVAAAIGSAAAGILKLATFSAQLGAEIFDLSQKVNFSAETLSSLKVAGELSSVTFANVSAALGIFDRNMVEATDKTSEMSRIFKGLKIDTDNNEVALRQTFEILHKMSDGATQTALAMKLFGRSGKEVLGIVKESHGNIDTYIEKMRELGFVITSEGAKKADEFGDKLTMVRTQLESVGRQIGQELIPVVSQAASDVSKWLKDNQGELRKTASELATVVSWFYKVAKAVADLSPQVFVVRVVRQFSDAVEGSRQGGMAAYERELQRNIHKAGTPGFPYPGGKPFMDTGEFVSPGSTVSGGGSSALDNQIKKLLSEGRGGGRGGGGGRGADPAATLKKLADINLKIVLDSLKAEEEAIARSYRKRMVSLEEYALESNVIEADRHRQTLAGLLSEMSAAEQLRNASQRQIAVREVEAKVLAEHIRHKQAMAKTEDELWRITDTVNQFIKKQADAIKESRVGTDSWNASINDLISSLAAEGATLDPVIEKQLRWNAVNAAAAEFGDKFRGSIEELNNSLTNNLHIAEQLDDAYRPFLEVLREAQDENQRLIDSINKEMGGLTPPTMITPEQLARAREMAGQLTSIISNSIHTGFEEGMAAGLVTFAQGILQMLEHAALRALEEKLFSIFSGLFGGGGGSTGGILGGLLGGVKGFAEGGFVFPHNWAVVGERGPELIRAGNQGASVLSGQGFSQVNHWHITAPLGTESLLRRETQSQVERRLGRAAQKGMLRR